MAFIQRLRFSPLLVPVLVLLFAVLPTAAFPSINCTETSFRTPSLAVDNLHYSSRVGYGSFRVTNIALNYTTIISCEARRCTPDSRGDGDDRVDTLATAVLNNGSVSITINQSWICSDKRWNDTVPVRLNFTATATAALPVKCNIDGACTSVKRLTLIRTSLLSPMAGTPRWLEPLTSQTVPICRPPLGATDLWEVKNVRWFDRDRPCFALGGPGPAVCPTNGVGLDLEVYNSLLNTTTRCSGVMQYSWTPDAEMRTISCEPVIVTTRKYLPQTTIILLQEGNLNNSLAKVQVNQTWQCDDEGPDMPVELQVHSYQIPIQLSCTHENGTLQFAGQNFPYRETLCRGNDTLVSPASVSTTAIPAYSLEVPYDNYFAGTCLLRHLRTTGWATDLMSKVLNFTGGPPNLADVAFFADSRYLRAGRPDNSALVPLKPGTNDTDGTVWVDCNPPSPNTDYPCRFKYDSATGRFVLRRWTQCNDIDRAHPWQADARVTEMMRVASLSDIVWEPMPPGFSPALWDGRPASAFPWLDPAR
ncbi:hypothetical protein QBC43DRAFT_335063 [Cladorrhinum sp. PSN259]|nr:hypothetical protein QBC43DRAFT_335063 [Cladorrhinum sp. PSN259]